MVESAIDVSALAVDERVFELYERMIGDVDLHVVLRETAEAVRETLRAERATIYLVIRETHELESAAVIGNVSRAIRVPISGSSLGGFCALSRRAFVVPDAHGDLSAIDPQLHFDPSWDRINNFCTRDVMCAPALCNDEVLGVVQVINHEDEQPFSEKDLKPLRTISRLVGYALYHARLYDELVTLKGLRRQKAEFMRIMVHELKSPVASAKMLAGALSYTHSDDDKLVGALSRIGGRLDDLLNMVEDILHLSRVRAGEPLSEVAVFDLAEETRAVCDSYREAAEAKGLALTLTLAEQPVWARFDRQGWHLVVSNLVSNAVKYTPSGKVDVRLRHQKDTVELLVSDTGLGIPADDIPKLFQEFFRASNVRGSKIKGTGVGLAGIKEMVERFGGHLTLESTEGEGSAFTACLPRAEAP